MGVNVKRRKKKKAGRKEIASNVDYIVVILCTFFPLLNIVTYVIVTLCTYLANVNKDVKDYKLFVISRHTWD